MTLLSKSMMLPSLSQNTCMKILGVTLNNKLAFFIPLETMERLYKAFLLPHLEYYAPLFLGIGKGQAKQIFI